MYLHVLLTGVASRFVGIANEIVTTKKGLTEPLPKQVTISSQKYTSLLPIKALCQAEVQT